MAGSITAIGDGRGYGVYLAEELTEAAYWAGRSADYLGIRGREVVSAEWNRAMRSQHPVTSEKLKANWGKWYLYDVSYGFNKSASVMALVDPRIIEVQRASHWYMQKFVDDLAGVRLQRFGEDGWRHSGNALQVAWDHKLNRNGDPHIHTHLTTVNMSYDSEEGKWKALQAIDLYRNQNQIQLMYRILIANRLREIGYRLEFEQDKQPAEWIFDDAAWKEHLRDMMSEGMWARQWGQGSAEQQVDMSRWLLEKYENAHPNNREDISNHIADEMGIPRRQAYQERAFLPWRIEGVPEALVDRYSSRAEELEEKFEQWAQEHGQEPTPEQAQIIARLDRSEKRDGGWEKIRQEILAGMEAGYEKQIRQVATEALEEHEQRNSQEPEPFYWEDLMTAEELKAAVVETKEKMAEQTGRTVKEGQGTGGKAPRVPTPILEQMIEKGYYREVEYRAAKAKVTGVKFSAPDNEAPLHVISETSYGLGMRA